MPQVEVCYCPGKLTSKSRDRLRDMLPIIVASGLDIPEIEEMRLTPNDIGVRFQQAGLDDVLTHDVEIKITANLYPEREKKLQEGATNEIICKIQPLIPSGRTCYVWPNLVKAAFVEAVGTGEVQD